MDLFKLAREDRFECPVSPIELDGEELRGVEVRREWRHINILIRCERPSFVIAIENKIRSGEHSNQLDRYRKVVESEFGGVKGMYVFLTVDGDDPSEDAKPNWAPYSYADLHRVLLRVRNASATSIGSDVLAFLDHYLRLIRGRLMDDQTIIDLCQRIYRTHRQALQLIYEHAGSPAAGILGEIERAITEHPGGWKVINSTSKVVIFIPNQWNEMLPEIGIRPKFDRRHWLVLRFEIRPKRGFYAASVWPTKDTDLRQRVITRLTANKKEFGFRLFLKNTFGKWTQLGRESIGEWAEDEGPDEVKVLEERTEETRRASSASRWSPSSPQSHYFIKA